MKYEKPEVVAAKSALEVISAVTIEKPPHLVTDRQGSNFPLSAGAYEADE